MGIAVQTMSLIIATHGILETMHIPRNRTFQRNTAGNILDHSADKSCRVIMGIASQTTALLLASKPRQEREIRDATP